MTRIASIDGLRGLAALAVVVQHSFPIALDGVTWLVTPGMVGVRLFFVLSGALISGLLWKMQDEGDTFGRTWRRFAIRRALRILPLAFFAMALCWLAGVPAMREQPWCHLTFTNNLASGYVSPWPDGLTHFWTLAVEEQIYALWPVLLLLTPRWPWMALALLLISPTARIWDEWGVWHAPIFYLDSFAAGSLIAWSARRNVLPFVAGLFAVLGVSVASVSWPDMDYPIGYAWLETGLVLLTASVVAFAWSRPTLPILSWRPLVWLGSISYGVYVWHESAPRILYQLGLPFVAEGWSVLALKAGLGIGCAALTWYGFERPINRLKDRPGQAPKQAPATAKPRFV